MGQQLRDALERKRAGGYAAAGLPLLLDVRQTAALLNVSLRLYYSMRANGTIPPPVRLGERIVRHRRSEIEALVEALAPDENIPEPAQLVRGKHAARCAR